MIGSIVKRTHVPWIRGAKVECDHNTFNTLWGLRAPDGHLYWCWRHEFGLTEKDDLFERIYPYD